MDNITPSVARGRALHRSLNKVMRREGGCCWLFWGLCSGWFSWLCRCHESLTFAPLGWTLFLALGADVFCFGI
jgi:hypothetical protein